MKKHHLALAMIIAAAALCGCAHQAYTGGEGAPGFFLGLVQGFVAPISLVIHLFHHDIRMYAVPNSGGWYDLGFLLGAGGWGVLGGQSSR